MNMTATIIKGEATDKRTRNITQLQTNRNKLHYKLKNTSTSRNTIRLSTYLSTIRSNSIFNCIAANSSLNSLPKKTVIQPKQRN